MKTISKIAILIAFIAFVSSCQKEKLPVPNGPASFTQNAANQRMSNASDTVTAPPTTIQGEESAGPDDIVGGGDDDRDGGDNGKKGKKDH